jgi:protocatechuate 3,4-dioxygenase, alpha subunit
VPFDDARLQAPHVSLAVMGRGILNHLYTRIYFDDEPANADDPVLARAPADRRGTLVARLLDEGVYRFDVVLQGANETVFFDLVIGSRP